jgi:hypothetical protein
MYLDTNAQQGHNHAKEMDGRSLPSLRPLKAADPAKIMN